MGVDWAVAAATLFFGTLPHAQMGRHEFRRHWMRNCTNGQLFLKAWWPWLTVCPRSRVAVDRYFQSSQLFSVRHCFWEWLFQNVLWFRSPLNLDLIHTGLPWLLLWMFEGTFSMGSVTWFGKHRLTDRKLIQWHSLAWASWPCSPPANSARWGRGSLRHRVFEIISYGQPVLGARKIPMWNTDFELETVQLTQGEQRKFKSFQVRTLTQNLKIQSFLDQAQTNQVVREQASQVGVRNKNRLLEKQQHKLLGDILRAKKKPTLRQELFELWIWIGHSQDIRSSKMWKTPWESGTHSASPRYSNRGPATLRQGPFH